MHNLIVSIPQEGGVVALGVGETSFDFLTGSFLHTNGQAIAMRSSLMMHGIEAMRSLIISTNKTIVVDLKGGNNFQLEAGERITLNNLDFQYVSIKTTEATNVKLLASSAAVSISNDPSMMEALGRISEPLYDADETKAQTITLDMGEDYSRVNIDVFAEADAATTFTVESSDDGAHWFTVVSVTGMSYHTGYHNAMRCVKLSSNAQPVVGAKVSLVLVATR